MAFLFKPKRTRYFDPTTKCQTRKGTPGAKKKIVQDPDWHAREVPGYPKHRSFRLCQDKASAWKMLESLVTKAERLLHGVDTVFADHALRPIDDHLSAYEVELRSRATTKRHVAQTVNRLRELFADCGFTCLAHLDGSKLTATLAERMQDKGPAKPLPVGQETFKRQELAELLGVDPKTVKSLIERNGLAWEKDGREVVCPRGTAEALLAHAGRGIGPQTANHYLQAARSFALWCIQNDRLDKNPFARCRCWRVEADKRHDRRPLTFEEAERLLTATAASPQVFRGLTGAQRWLLYLTALGTGFRVQELASLTPAHLSLDGEQPTIALSAGRAKNRKRTVQHISKALANELGEAVKGLADDKPLWPGTWVRVAAKMLRIDLAAAKIPYKVDGVDGPVYADLHALRHTFGSWLDHAGLTLKQMMNQMRHVDPRLTTARYGKAQAQELSDAANRLTLPGKPKPGPEGDEKGEPGKPDKEAG